MCGGCGSAVSGPGRRARMCGIGAARAVLHIRSGPTSDGSAESCENSSALNAVEILPCAEGPALHMGARPLKTDILEEPRNHAENPEPARAGAALQCAAPPHGPGRTPGAPPENSPGRDSPTTGHPPGSGPPPGPRREPEPHPNPAGDRPPPPHRPLGHRSWRERVNDAIPRERRNRRAPESHAPTTFLSRRTARHWPDRASHPGEHVRKRQQGLRSHPPLRGAG